MAVNDRGDEYRQSMREQGYRPVRVPDVRAETFAAEAHRQSAVAAGDDADDQDFIEAVSAPWGGECRYPRRHG